MLTRWKRPKRSWKTPSNPRRAARFSPVHGSRPHPQPYSPEFSAFSVEKSAIVRVLACLKLARSHFSLPQLLKTVSGAFKRKAGGTPIQFHRLVPTGLAGCSSSRARRLFQGQRQKKEVRRQGGVPRRLGGGGSGIECRILLSRGLKQSDGSRGTSKSLKRIIGQDLFWSP